MDLNLHPAAPAPGGRNSVSGKQDQAGASSDFARLLARHFGGSTENIPRKDFPEISSPKDENPDRTNREANAAEHPGQEASRPTGRDSKVQAESRDLDSSQTALPGAEDSLAEASLAFSSLTGFLSMMGPVENLNYTDPTASGMEIIPADVRARLAGEIAARFTDRQGIQTLTLKLEPEHLGKVDVRMQAKGDRLSVRLVAANREAESALRENIKDLAEAIRDKTGKYQQVDVRVELKSQNGQGSHGTGQDESDEDSRRHAHEESQGNADHRRDGRDQEKTDDPKASEHPTQGG